MPDRHSFLRKFAALKFEGVQGVLEKEALQLVYCFSFGDDPDEGVLSIYRACDVSRAPEVPVVKEWYQNNRLWFFPTSHVPEGFDAYVAYLCEHRDKVYVQLDKPLLSIALSMKEEVET